MKKIDLTIKLDQAGRIGRQLKVLFQTFVILSFLSLLMFIVLGISGMLQSKLLNSPVSSMKGLAASVSSRFFADMIGMEIPDFQRKGESFTFSQKNVSSFMFQFLTNINPQDPKSLLAREVPGMEDDTILLRRGLSNDVTSYPMDYTPSNDVLKPDKGSSSSQGNSQNSARGNGGSGDGNSGNGQQNGNAGQNSSSGASGGSDKSPELSTNGRKVIFIYHSHNRESWIPELKARGEKIEGINQAYDPKINITLAGKRLAAKLGELGVGAVDSSTDYVSQVAGFNYNYSYKYSLKTVKEAFAANPDYTYFFDIHRDSQERDLTTVNIGGKAYAQVYFIIGHKNPHWEKNEEFASKIHARLEQLYPGVSRGIYGKGPKSGNAEYNQSFSPNSVLIEIGGPENTLAETYRTVDILAKVIADIYWDAEKVNANKQSAAK
ncbi:stage II sporulation protein P [Ferviditalea candida]|uniref:Stage II sporulation protein P n=1 Tax=Ferviditalea candida TaxID=3108399 RepID=A0ABU5ZDY3_9BACL|nr:stage II sporulation protein P [Paenibacillaceae bacterium T2]